MLRNIVSRACRMGQSCLVTASVMPSATRCISTTAALRGMEEFFPPQLKEGQVPQKAGRSWTAAELRLKSFEDLHKLWFVCLKERNMLLSERLFFKQIGQAAADPHRLQKVRKTMARIKVVLGERARAQEALQAQKLVEEKLAQTSEKAAAVKDITTKWKEEVMVTYKKFGRKYTVAESLAPKMTNQKRKVAFKRRRFFAQLEKRTQEYVDLRQRMTAAADTKKGVKTSQ